MYLISKDVSKETHKKRYGKETRGKQVQERGIPLMIRSHSLLNSVFRCAKHLS